MDEIRAVLSGQSDAWNRGDLASFMNGYVKSDQTSYISGNTEVYGYDALKQRYESRYGTDTSTMGKLGFSALKFYPLGNDGALCIGHWRVTWESKPEVSGVFSLVFIRSGGQWRILHDHTTAFTH